MYVTREQQTSRAVLDESLPWWGPDSSFSSVSVTSELSEVWGPQWGQKLLYINRRSLMEPLSLHFNLTDVLLYFREKKNQVFTLTFYSFWTTTMTYPPCSSWSSERHTWPRLVWNTRTKEKMPTPNKKSGVLENNQQTTKPVAFFRWFKGHKVSTITVSP